MKKLPFLFLFLLLCLHNALARQPAAKRGAANIQELSQAVFNALQQNQFNSLDQYLPQDSDLKILKRRSSEDMQLVLERTSADSIKRELQRNFNTIEEQAAAQTMNWHEWQPAETKTSRRDRKNPLLYRLETTLNNATGGKQVLVYEAVRIRGRFFLFRQMVFEAKT